MLSTEIFAVHAVALKDKSVQLGMINVPIYDLAGEIQAPWIDTDNFPALPSSDEVKLSKLADTLTVEESDKDEPMEQVKIVLAPKKSEPAHDDLVSQQPPGKRMKMIKKTRTFMENGYQMTEVINELVECEEGEEVEIVAPVVPVAPSATATKPKQSSMMSFFKKK